MTTLDELFEHNAWANLYLLEFCEKLTDAQLDGSTDGTYGSIRSTLTHYLSGEERYIQRITGVAVDDPMSNDAFPGFEKLKERARRNGERLKEIAGEVSADKDLKLPWGGKQAQVPAGVVIVQAINHGTEHRAQILVNLTQQGVEPPALDGWTYGQSSGRIQLAS